MSEVKNIPNSDALSLPKGDALSLPKGWVETTLGEVIERVTKGTTPKTFSSNVDDINYIKSDALQYTGFLVSDRFVKISHETNDKLKRSQLKIDDILLSMAGENLGKTGLIQQKHLPANTNQAVAIITVDKQIIQHIFLWYKLRNNSTVKYFKTIPSQSAQPNINFQEIKSLPIILPPLPEQKSIAAILTAFDDKIELLQAQNKTLEETAQTIFKEWFGEFQIDDELPEGWRVGKLGDIATTISKGTTPRKTDVEGLEASVPFLKVKDISDNGRILKNDLMLIPREVHHKELRRSILETNDILFSIAGTIGRVAIVTEELNNINCNQAVAFIRLKNKTKYLEYVHLWIKSRETQNGINSSIVQGVQANVSLTVLGNLLIVLPSDDNMDKWNQTIKPIYLKLNNNDTQIQTLTKTRDALLPKLMNGEIRVKEFKNQ